MRRSPEWPDRVAAHATTACAGGVDGRPEQCDEPGTGGGLVWTCAIVSYVVRSLDEPVDHCAWRAKRWTETLRCGDWSLESETLESARHD